MEEKVKTPSNDSVNTEEEIKFDYNMDIYDPYLSTFELRKYNCDKKLNLYLIEEENNKENCSVKREFYRNLDNAKASILKEEAEMVNSSVFDIEKVRYSKVSQVDYSDQKLFPVNRENAGTTRKFSFRDLEQPTEPTEEPVLSMNYSNCSKETVKRRVYCDKKISNIPKDSMNQSKHVMRNLSKVVKESSKYLLLSDEEMKKIQDEIDNEKRSVEVESLIKESKIQEEVKDPESVEENEEKAEEDVEKEEDSEKESDKDDVKIDNSDLKISNEVFEGEFNKKSSSDIQMVESYVNDEMILGKERDCVLRAIEKLRDTSFKTGRGKF